MLRPLATPARAWYEAHPDRPGKLIWGPQYLALSAAGDFGVSSGPWRFEGERDGKPLSAHGHFFSIWRHDAQHGWQVAFDHGVGHAPAATAVEDTRLVALIPDAGPGHASADAAAQGRALAAADDALRARLGAGVADAYARIARAETLWLRDGALPRQSATPPPASAATRTVCGCGPRLKLAVAASGDLGYTLGGADSARERGADLRVWRFEPRRGWTLLADVVAAAD